LPQQWRLVSAAHRNLLQIRDNKGPVIKDIEVLARPGASQPPKAIWNAITAKGGAAPQALVVYAERRHRGSNLGPAVASVGKVF
jgi:hypothetical protein